MSYQQLGPLAQDPGLTEEEDVLGVKLETRSCAIQHPRPPPPPPLLFFWFLPVATFMSTSEEYAGGEEKRGRKLQTFHLGCSDTKEKLKASHTLPDLQGVGCHSASSIHSVERKGIRQNFPKVF